MCRPCIPISVDHAALFRGRTQITLTISVLAPSTPDSYVLEYQLLQSGNLQPWFPQALDSSIMVGSSPPPAPAQTFFTTIPDGTPLAERLGSGTYYFLRDGLGSIIGLADSNGNLVKSYSYDPYSNTSAATESVPNPYRYIGAEWDRQTGLYNMGERHYDPSIGRFTQLDPLGGGYGYAANDPINNSDPSRMCLDTLSVGTDNGAGTSELPCSESGEPVGRPDSGEGDAVPTFSEGELEGVVDSANKPYRKGGPTFGRRALQEHGSPSKNQPVFQNILQITEEADRIIREILEHPVYVEYKSKYYDVYNAKCHGSGLATMGHSSLS